MSTANNDEMTAEQLSLTLQRVQGLWDQIEEQTKPPRHLLLPDEDLINAIARKPHQLVPISPGTRAGPMTRNMPYKQPPPPPSKRMLFTDPASIGTSEDFMSGEPPQKRQALAG